MRMKRLVLIGLVLILAAGGAFVTTYSKKVASETSDSCFTSEEIVDAQQAWGEAIVSIGKAYTSGEDYQALAEMVVDQLYGYDEGIVLFKPTKAAREQFRTTEEAAVSYFVEGIVPEDGGFAIQPWREVRFENAGMIVNCNSAIAMGNYYFTDVNGGQEVKVEFTFGYRKDDDGKALINLHHSSLPYEPAD